MTEVGRDNHSESAFSFYTTALLMVYFQYIGSKPPVNALRKKFESKIKLMTSRIKSGEVEKKIVNISTRLTEL